LPYTNPLTRHPLVDTEAPSASEPAADPFAQTEKTIDQKQWAKKNTSRITELSLASARLSSDPYAVSSALRRRFREEKKVLLDKQDRDGDLRERYGLHEDVDLGEEEVGLSREMWEAGRERKGLAVEPEGEGSDAGGESVRAIAGTPGSAIKGKGRANGLGDSASPSLAQVLRRSTARKYDPFGDAADLLLGAGALGSTSASRGIGGGRVRGKIKDPAIGAAVTGTRAAKEKEEAAAGGNGIGIGMGLGGGLLAGYGSD
jgi:coiled-coil domain-containing protein 130